MSLEIAVRYPHPETKKRESGQVRRAETGIA